MCWSPEKCNGKVTRGTEGQFIPIVKNVKRNNELHALGVTQNYDAATHKRQRKVIILPESISKHNLVPY
jgi:hypothetical protein